MSWRVVGAVWRQSARWCRWVRADSRHGVRVFRQNLVHTCRAVRMRRGGHSEWRRVRWTLNMGERATLEVDGGPVEVTSLNDVIYPVTGFRKGEVLDYYVKISEHLLPHLRERPIKLKLFWEGTMRPPRDERDAPPDFLPKWMETAEIARAHEDADMEFALVNDVRSLLWL